MSTLYERNYSIDASGIPGGVYGDKVQDFLFVIAGCKFEETCFFFHKAVV